MWDLLEAATTPAVGAMISSLRVKRILKANSHPEVYSG